jgi:hypothetical protein
MGPVRAQQVRQAAGGQQEVGDQSWRQNPNGDGGPGFQHVHH